MGAWIAFLGFKSGRIKFGVSFATPAKFPMVFGFVRTIALNTFRSLDATRECGVAPLPAVLALGNSRIHVSASNSRDVVALQGTYLVDLTPGAGSAQ